MPQKFEAYSGVPIHQNTTGYPNISQPVMIPASTTRYGRLGTFAKEHKLWSSGGKAKAWLG